MYQAMVTTCWQGPELGWAKRVTSSNEILDPTTDLYDNAFALFALGWYYRVAPSPDVLGLMLETADVIDKRLRHPKLGFWHQVPPQGPRLQNPHMHLLEACLVCYESTQAPIFDRLAREVIGLFQSHFFNPDTQTLCEYFDDDLIPLTGQQGHLVEPGHQFEWAWILVTARRLLGLELGSLVKGLIGFGEAKGVDDATAATYNVILDDGGLIDAGSRTWPNTERLKAAVARFELDGQDPWPVVLPTLDLLFSRYLNTSPPGGWVDAFDGDGHPTAVAMPTSTLYHLFLAFAEVLKVADAPEAQ
jgi:N-acylglucosamine 2-epimerase/mannose-6-phosphate isomerase